MSSAAETIFVGAIGTSTTPDEVSCDSYTEQGSAPHYMVEHQDAKFEALYSPTQPIAACPPSAPAQLLPGA
jgi:hypothetical protein